MKTSSTFPSSGPKSEAGLVCVSVVLVDTSQSPGGPLRLSPVSVGWRPQRPEDVNHSHGQTQVGNNGEMIKTDLISI